MTLRYEKLRRRPEGLFYDVRCDGCDRELQNGCPKPSQKENFPWECLQPDEGLVLELDGGYGMFIDPYDAQAHELKVVFCRDCAIKLCESFPAIKERCVRHIHAQVGHFCVALGASHGEGYDTNDLSSFVWEPLSLCVPCNEVDEQLEEKQLGYSRIEFKENLLRKAIETHGVHEFVPNEFAEEHLRPLLNPCTKCNWSAWDEIHAVGPAHEVVLHSYEAGFEPIRLVGILRHTFGLGLAEAKAQAERFVAGDHLVFPVGSLTAGKALFEMLWREHMLAAVHIQGTGVS